MKHILITFSTSSNSSKILLTIPHTHLHDFRSRWVSWSPRSA